MSNPAPAPRPPQRRQRKPKQDRIPSAKLLDSSRNPYNHMTPTEIVNQPDYAKEIAKFMKTYRSDVAGDPQMKIYQAAMAKFQTQFEQRNPSFPRLSLTKFTEIVAMDDLPSIVAGLSSAAVSAYSNPAVKKVVDGLLSKGYRTITSLFTSSPPSRDARDLLSPMSDYAFDGVDLDHVFCSFADVVPATSDPSDIPKTVYTSKFEGEYSFVVSTAGDGALLLQGQGFWLNGTSQNTPWIATNTSVGYDPNATTITGTWTYANPGPLSGSINLFSQAKLIGVSVEVKPFSSANKTQGGYVAGIVTDQLGTSSSIFTGTALNFQALSSIPFFDVCDMKTTSRYSSFPSRDPSLAEWWLTAGIPLVGTVRPDYGAFFLSVSGAEPSTAISIRYSLTYSIVPTAAGMLLVRGAVPKMAPYTNVFLEFLRSKYPSIVNWPQSKCLELYQHFKSKGTTSYRKLIENVSYVFDFQPQGHRLPSNSRMQIEDNGSEVMM